MINFSETEKGRVAFRLLRGTFIQLGFIDTWAPNRFDTHIYCLKYHLKKII